MADDDQNVSYSSSPSTHWTHIYPHSHHGTPAQEYTGFNWSMPHPPTEPTPFSSATMSRPMPQNLQPLIMPQWPSMLNSQSHTTFQPLYPQPVQPIQPMQIGPLATPVSAGSNRSGSTPRRTLTDQDRKRMCQYAEEHPGSKQTEIGAIFGVERSTVSKVLRQKDKFLTQDDGSRSPIKRAKGRSPDIERALAVWAKNQERKGLPLSDEMIRDKARAFSATTTSPDNHSTLSSSWIEKFKLKNNLMGARSRKGSLAPDDDSTSAAASSSHTPSNTSPTSPQGIGSPSPIELHSAHSHESLKNESPDSYLGFASRGGPFHSQSTNSLHSAFTDTAPSSFSPGPLSPTSPFFTPDSGTAPSPFVDQIPNPPLTARPILPASNINSQRPRSQTMPLLDQYMTGAVEADLATPRYASATVLESPMEESPDPVSSLDATIQSSQRETRPHTVAPAETMRPPPLPMNMAQRQHRRSITPANLNSYMQPSTSPEEARRALEVVLSFFQQQPSGFLDLEESVTIGKLMEKLKTSDSK